jgi:hypothetical protein
MDQYNQKAEQNTQVDTGFMPMEDSPFLPKTTGGLRV